MPNYDPQSQAQVFAGTPLGGAIEAPTMTVDAALQEQSTLLDSLSKAFAALDEKLHNIKRPVEAPELDAVRGGPTPAPLVEQISAHNDQLAQLLGGLSLLHDRIAL